MAGFPPALAAFRHNEPFQRMKVEGLRVGALSPSNFQ